MNGFFIAASIASFIAFLIHVFVGGPKIAKPLLEARDIQTVPKLTNYYCWHGITIVLFAMAASFAWAAFYPDGIELAVLATGLSGAFTVWGLGLVTVKGQSTRTMPQWVLFAVIAGLGLAGFF